MVRAPVPSGADRESCLPQASQRYKRKARGVSSRPGFSCLKIEREPNQAIIRARASGKTFPEFKRVSGITSS